MPFREFEENIDSGKNNVGFGIDFTNRCNAHCLTCFYIEDPRNRVFTRNIDMTLQQLETAVQAAADNNFTEFYILGGEPTVHEDILPALELVSQYDFNPLILVTNGIKLADEEFCRKVADTGALVAVQRHVIGDGSEQERIQDLLMGVPNTLPKVNKAFENIEEYFSPDKVAVQCCITKPVVESGQIYEVFRYARQNGFEHVMECTKSGIRFPRGNEHDISPLELKQVYETFQKIDREEFDTNVEVLSPQAYGKTCHMPETGVHCLIDGTIIPCVGQQVPLGNIFNGDKLIDILATSKRHFFQNVTDRIVGECSDCEQLVDCSGGCRGEAYEASGCFNTSSQYCPQITVTETVLPKSCKSCALEDFDGCNIKD